MSQQEVVAAYARVKQKMQKQVREAEAENERMVNELISQMKWTIPSPPPPPSPPSTSSFGSFSQMSWSMGADRAAQFEPQTKSRTKSGNPMTPQRREKLRKVGLSDVEIEGLAALEMPPFMEAVFVVFLLKARTTAKVKTYPWWKDLGLQARPTSRGDARKAYSDAMLKAHPDHGGTAETMAKVRAAWERAQQEFPESACKE